MYTVPMHCRRPIPIPVHVHHLRKQLTALQATVEIETHRGLGYLLFVPKEMR